jgi:hypothetical protein
MKTDEITSSIRNKMNESEYLSTYNELLSSLSVEFCDDFPAIASPTLSKQEAVTRLYEKCLNPVKNEYLIKNWLLFPVRLIWHFLNILLLSNIYRVKSIPSNSIYFRGWLVPQSFKTNNIRDEYFRELPNDLRERGCVVIQAFQPLGYHMAWKLLRYKLNDDQIIPIGMLTFSDILKLFYSYLTTGWLQVKNEYVLRGNNITSEINRSLAKDFIDFRSFLAYQEKYISKKIKENGVKKFVYVFENQSWEKVYCNYFSNTNIITIGYQSSGFTDKFLNFFPSQKDLNDQPQPDFIFTVGDAFTKYLTEKGCYRSEICSFAAMRFDHPVIDSHYIVKEFSKDIHMCILYAFPVHKWQYGLIIDLLIDVFGESDIKVHFKFHPLCQSLRGEYKNILPDNFSIIDIIDNSTLSQNYDVVLFNDNSFGIESLMYGVKCFDVDLFDNDLDKRLIYFDDWDVRISKNGLLQLRDNLLNGYFDKSCNVNVIRKYINYMYSPYIFDRSYMKKFSIDDINN